MVDILGLSAPSPPPARTHIVATDLDRTFSQLNLTIAPQAVQRARELRRHGTRVILVTGRRLAELPKELESTFDALVLEGGPVWGTRGRWTVSPVPDSFWNAAEAIADSGHEVHQGWASFSIPAQALQVVEAQCEGFSVRRNRDRIDVTPAGYDKGTGLRAAVEFLHAQDPWTLAIGDAANDLPMLQVADVAVAVANAEACLIEAGALRAPHPAHRGFMWAVSNFEPTRRTAHSKAEVGT